MTQDSQKEPEGSIAANPMSSTSSIRRILSIALVVLFIISSIFLMIKYSLNIYNGAVAANATATVQTQTRVAEYATVAATEKAAAATEEAVRGVVSHMTATAIGESNATAEAQANASPSPYPPSIAPVNSEGNKWPDASDNFGSCGSSNGTYQITATYEGYFEYCLAKPEIFTNFIYEAQMIITQGDGGGLIIRADNTGNKFYYFLVNQDGTYEFRVFDLIRNVNGTILSSGSSPSISTGLNAPNIIAVAVIDNVFQLYVNHHRIAVVGDTSFSRGLIGLSASYENNPTTVIFQQVKVWIE